MRTGGRGIGWLAGAALAVAGCHTPTAPPAPTFAPPPAPPTLPMTQPGSLEPDYAGLPTADPTNDTIPPRASLGTPYRELTEAACRDLAAAHSPEAAQLRNADFGMRNEDVSPPRRLFRCFNPQSAIRNPQWEDLRELAAADARNTAAAEALDQFYRLADAEGRGDLLRDTVPLLDQLRATAKSAREKGVRVPTDPDELDRQRGQLLAQIGQADLGIALLNTDLKRLIGVDGRDPGRLWPTGPFPMSADPVDAEAAVQVALQRRPDLQLLRTAYHRLTPDSLADIKEILRTRLTGAVASARPAAVLFQHHRPDEPSSETLAELAVYRQQLYDLTAAKERAAADEVRAAVATLTAQARQVGLARWRADQLTAQIEKAKATGPLAELPARVEAVRARAEVVAALFAWQQARVKLLAAQGALAGFPP